jgi:hypothetical protein
MARKKIDDQGHSADELNAFRRTVRLVHSLMVMSLAKSLKQHMLRGHGTRAK